MPAAVVTESLRKRFGDTEALAGVDLRVEEGTVLGLLGPNGAGKTTLVRILATLLRPDEGRAEVFGVDVAADPEGVRESIGLAGQFAAVDDLLTGHENLQMFGRLFGLPRRRAGERATELLDRFDLADAAERPAKTYSGGMRRRLDLASSLLCRPRILFLDEPTTGLDPRSRNQIWEVVRELVREGTTVLLTTQYLEEADRLADRIAVIDHGRVIAEGTGDELKDRAGGQVVEVRLSGEADRGQAERAIAAVLDGQGQTDGENGRMVVGAGEDGLGTVAAVTRALREAEVAVADVGLRRPTLDDVFLQLTGKAAAEAAENGIADQESERRAEVAP